MRGGEFFQQQRMPLTKFSWLQYYFINKGLLQRKSCNQVSTLCAKKLTYQHARILYKNINKFLKFLTWKLYKGKTLVRKFIEVK